MLLPGRKLNSLRVMAMASRSSSATKWTLPLTVACIAAPPTSSMLTSRPVTDLITCGPVMKSWAFCRVMMMKSISAGEYAAPPAQGPAMIAICGTTPDRPTLR